MDAYIITLITSIVLWFMGFFAATEISDRKLVNNPALLIIICIICILIPFVNIALSLFTPFLLTKEK